VSRQVDAVRPWKLSADPDPQIVGAASTLFEFGEQPAHFPALSMHHNP
jgi:hypothetical protein